MSNEVVKESLSPPWYIHRNKLSALFEEDDQVTIGKVEKGLDDQYTAEITVSDKEKQAALQQIILQNVNFGNVKLTFTFADPLDIPQANDDISFETFLAAFKGNPIMVKAMSAVNPWQRPETVVIFRKEVIQFWADNMADFYGNYNGLAVDIAKEVLVPVRIAYTVANGSE